MMSSNRDQRAVPVYLFLVLALSSFFYFLIIKSGHLGAADGNYVTGLMWCPGLAALLTCGYLGRDLGSLGWKWGNPRYQAMAYLIPLGYGAVTYMIVWAAGLGGFYNSKFVSGFTQHFSLGALPSWVAIPFYFFFVATTGMLNSCYTALGEEIGWRGFLVPELARRNSFTATALFSGCVWSLWHYPILLFADYSAGTPAWYGLSCFTVMIVGMSFVLAWLRLRSGSLWTGVLLHASHNIFIQDFFTPITANTGRTKYIIDEFGIGLALVVTVFGAFFWRRRSEVERGVATTT